MEKKKKKTHPQVKFFFTNNLPNSCEYWISEMQNEVRPQGTKMYFCALSHIKYTENILAGYLFNYSYIVSEKNLLQLSLKSLSQSFTMFWISSSVYWKKLILNTK